MQQDLLRATEAEAKAYLRRKPTSWSSKNWPTCSKRRREGMITEAFGKLLAIANKVVDGILIQPLVPHENTICMVKHGHYIPHRVFSGTEKALAYIAIAVALSADAPLKLVLLDEFGRLDAGNRTQRDPAPYRARRASYHRPVHCRRHRGPARLQPGPPDRN